MLAWILDYLGHSDIRVMEGFFETWKASGRDVLYKPVARPSRIFKRRLNPSVRADSGGCSRWRDIRFVDFRSREEFTGSTTISEDKAGHIPGAVNIAWRDLGDPHGRILKAVQDLAQIANAVGLSRDDKIVAYCRSGPRAALGYLALSQLGADVRLFDGSFMQWSQAGLPVET